MAEYCFVAEVTCRRQGQVTGEPVVLSVEVVADSIEKAEALAKRRVEVYGYHNISNVWATRTNPVRPVSVPSAAGTLPLFE